jgi:NADH:ubiquinone oxidoreductase subunit 6 (subunit J)
LTSLDIEYIGIFLIIVYIGAIAILFLFVIMLLNLKLLLKFDSPFRYIPMVALCFIALPLVFQPLSSAFYYHSAPATLYSPFTFSSLSSIHAYAWQFQSLIAIGQSLYTSYAFYLIFSGILLLLGLFGAIILTFPVSSGSISLQNIYLQNSRLLSNNSFHYEPFSH